MEELVFLFSKNRDVTNINPSKDAFLSVNPKTVFWSKIQQIRSRKEHLCPEMHIIRCTLNFGKPHEESRYSKSKHKPPVCNFRVSICV